MLNKKNSVDKLLLTANTTILIAFLFVFQAPLANALTKTIIMVSFTLFLVSLVMIIWYLYRQPIRLRLFNQLKEKSIKKYSKRIGAFIENIAVPLARLKTRDEFLGKLATVKSKEEHAELMVSIEKEIEDLKSGKSATMKTKEEDEATGYVIEGFLDQITSASKADFNEAFKSPLKESAARLKYVIDRISFKTRRHLFVAASVTIIFSIFVEFLSK